MASIQSSPRPLVFRLDNSLELPVPENNGTDEISIRTVTRALEGMQKEAIVHNDFSAMAWRMVCDEGPWLNGTDLSSFPLGFFSAGMVATVAEEITALAKRRDIAIYDLQLVQDATYSMEGSAVKQTMRGSALPLDTTVTIRSDAGIERLQELARHALAGSPADAVMRSALASRFKLSLNKRILQLGDDLQSATPPAQDPAALFDQARPHTTGVANNIIEKMPGGTSAATVAGTAVGLAGEQKRLVQVRAELSMRDDGLKSIQTRCIRPAGGSVFRFLGDDLTVFGGGGRAPSGLDYLSAGLSFCYMTQLGRYAAIVKQDLSAYGIVQDTGFSMPGGAAGRDTPATATAADTHVFIDSSAPEDANRTLVKMAGQTCYLHACYSGVAKTRLRVLTC